MSGNALITNSSANGAAAQQATSTTYKTQFLMANSSATTSSVFTSSTAGNVNIFYPRGRLNDILVGTNGTPADNEIEFDAYLATALSSIWALTNISSFSSAFMVDYGVDPGFIQHAGVTATAETGLTFVNEKWYLGLNQRASYRWIANPGQELVLPSNSQAAGANGLGVRARSAAYTGAVTVEGIFQI